LARCTIKGQALRLPFFVLLRVRHMRDEIVRNLRSLSGFDAHRFESADGAGVKV